MQAIRRLGCPLRGVLLLLGLSSFLLCESAFGAESDPSIVPEVSEEGEGQSPRGQTFYKWTDEKGHLYFTDDWSKIPERFRNDLETLELPPLPVVTSPAEEEREPNRDSSPLPSEPSVRGTDRQSDKPDRIPPEPYVYKEIPFSEFIHIQVGMDEAEVLSRLGFPSIITPSDYFYGDRGRYRSRIIRLIYLGNRDLAQKTTIIEIRDGRVVHIERIFPF
jgi:hypothetical protein